MSYSQELEKILGNTDEMGSKYFTIDDATRKITPPKDFTYLGVESDSNSKRIWFECPRFVGDNLDLTELNVYINYQNANGDKDRWYAEDVTVEGDKIHFSWKLERKVLKYKGTVKFIVCALETDAEGEKDPEWNTTLCQGTVLEGLEVENPEPPEEEYDLINQLLSITKNSIAEVENISAQTKADIEASRLQALSDVESTQDKAVEAVESAKEGVLEYIGTGIDNTLSKKGVAAEAKETGDRLKTKGSVILNEASGNLIALADSDEAEFRGMKIFGKTKQFSTTGNSLFDFTQLKGGTSEDNGVTVINNGDGSFTITSTGIADTCIANHTFGAADAKELLSTLKVGTLTLDCGNKSAPYILIMFNDASSTRVATLTNRTNAKSSIQITEDIISRVTRIAVQIYLYEGYAIEPGTIKPMLYYAEDCDGTWEPYTGGIPSPNPNYPQALESVGDSGSVEQVVCGKNLFYDNVNNWATYNVNGTNRLGFELPSGLTQITLSGTVKSGHATETWTLGIYEFNGNETYTILSSITFSGTSRSAKYNLDSSKKYIVASMSTSNKDTISSNLNAYYWQIEVGAVATPYEPPKPKSLTIPTPNGLPGVPVSSGGNYTDENGQQYISDYKDYERMVKVQTCCKLVLDGSENWSLREYNGVKYLQLSLMPAGVGLSGIPLPGSETVICTHALPAERNVVTSLKENTCGVNTSLYFHRAQGGITYTNADDWKTYLTNQYEAGTPVIVCYRLAEPIETPLSAEEIEAYKALHTNYPVTTIYNSDGAHTEVDYVADTKNYIDNKFAALEAKMLSVTK